MQAHHDGIAPQEPDQVLDQPHRFFIKGQRFEVAPDQTLDDAGLRTKTDLLASRGLCTKDQAEIAEIEQAWLDKTKPADRKIRRRDVQRLAVMLVEQT